MQQSHIIALVCVALVAKAGVAAKPSRSLLAPAPGPASDAENATAESLFIIEAAMATFTRTSPGGVNGTLTLRSVDPASTFFSEEPVLMSGKISSTELSGPQFFKDGDSNAWLNNANLAMYAPKSNSSSMQSTNIFRLNSAPVTSEGGTVWTMNVTYAPPTTKSIYAADPQSFQAAAGSGELVTNYSPVVLFVGALCYVYNRYTGYIYYWYYC